MPESLAVNNPDVALAAQFGRMRYDPLNFVRYVFPWGEAGGPLEHDTGPDAWQAEFLTYLGNAMLAGLKPADAVSVAVEAAIKMCVASGHGVGKSALVSWVVIWFATCFPMCQIVVTANTRMQLLTKTWRELAKWHRLTIHKHWFHWTATQFKHVRYPETWFATAVPWSENASEAFAGTHEKFVLIIFDEASLIADVIWDVTEGAMSTANAVWLAFGNFTRNTGKFSQCFGSLKHRWKTWQIDSRTCKMTNKAKIAEDVADYGEDSDFVRVRWRGVAPRAGSNQLIGGDLYTQATLRPNVQTDFHAKLIGCDVARHGDDQSAIIRRRGLWTSKARRFRISDLMMLASVFAEEIHEFQPDGVFVDVTGMGWGVYDRLQQLVNPAILIPVQVGEASKWPERFFNLRAEIWWGMREWIKNGGCLVADPEMEADLTGPEYGYVGKEVVQLEKKEDMKARGLASPDAGDALALTFAVKVDPKTPPKGTWHERLAAQRLSHKSAETA